MPDQAERFGQALSVLAGHGDIKKRLIQAFEENLSDIDQQTLPSPVKGEFRSLQRRLTSVAPLNGEGPVCASVRKMSVFEADECARMVVGMYGELLRVDLEEGSATANDPGAESADVPPILLKSV